MSEKGLRLYNPAVGRFLSVDPLTSSYSMLTPYQFASNRPIDGIDLDGKEYEWYLAKELEKAFFKTNHIEKIGVGAGNEQKKWWKVLFMRRKH